MKVKFDFNPIKDSDAERVEMSSEEKDELLSRISDFVLESVLSYVGEAKSPITGDDFEELRNKEYIKRVGRKKATLELTGDLLDSVRVEKKKGNVLRLTVSEDQMGKADGHNNHSGKSSLPTRRFIPLEKEDGKNMDAFNGEIQRGVDDIIEEYLEEIGEQ